MAQKTNTNFSRVKKVAQDLDISRSTILRMVKAGTFPKQVMLSPRCSAFRNDEIEAWKNAKQ